MNFAKFLRTPFLQNTSGRVLLKRKKTKCLPISIEFSSFSDINTTLEIGITITWSFTLRYVIATTSLWCWKKTLYNNVTSISIRNRSTWRCKSNKKSMSSQYRGPTGLFLRIEFFFSSQCEYYIVFYFFALHIRVFFRRHWRFTGQQGKGGDHFLFHCTISFRSRTLRHLFATLHVTCEMTITCF